jgi:endonuclease YncB( thermonuclease family)
MPARLPTLVPRTYAQLRAAVVAVVVEGRRAIDRAWLETYHETGRLIHEHVLLFRDRADYGARTFEKLSADTEINQSTLKECVRFYRCYPIRRPGVELDWSKWRLLCQVGDKKERADLLKAAVRNHWTKAELETRVRSHNALTQAADDAAPNPEVELLKPRCGVPGLRLLVERPDGLGIDLGFKTYAALPAAQRARLKAGDIVRWDADGVHRIADATPAQLFTYRATVRKVTDGDTLDIAITLAPGITRDLKLRLRGIDCPEVATAAGRAAKAFVQKLLAPGDEVTVCTTKPDKYDRYLADVFIREPAAAETRPLLTADRSPLTAEGSTFLNNALLTAGHAIPYDGGAKEE